MIIKCGTSKAIIAFFFLFSFTLVLATVPPTLNYQGHLTGGTGAPIDGPVNMVFAIYNIDSGGSVLWSEMRSVTIDQGVFSVELGGTVNPFPLGLFEQPLWMGLTVNTDAEMSPRRPISSVGFSFKADDANTLEGVSASTLDQSAHVIDIANPHNVTATQSGAADAATLLAHTGNTSNPHSVTAAQTGAATSANFNVHTTDISAHHSRYTSTEAVSAMGLKSDINALNHDKYSDINAVAALLTADGAGSTLDADLVDGLQASELIDAAQDEVRTPISSLPYTINLPGSYYITGNLDGSSGGIGIDADDVSLDLMGYSLDGGGAGTFYGIYIFGRSNISIMNGTIKDFGLAGIYQGSTTARYTMVMDVRVLGNGTSSADTHSGIFLFSSNSHVERCTAGNNGGYGIHAYTGSKLINNTAYNNSGFSGIHGSSGSILSGNTAYNNPATHAIRGGPGSTLSNNAAYNNTGTYGIYGGDGARLSGNTAYNNYNTIFGTTAIFGGIGSTITNNTANTNTGTYGIYSAGNSTIIGNTANNNTGTGIVGFGSSNINGNTVYNNSVGIQGGGGASFIGNTARYNDSWGILCGVNCLIKDNSIHSNNQNNTFSEGGVNVDDDSRVIGNTLDGNGRNNIVVNGVGAILKDNHVTDSSNGVLFNNDGNYYIDNTGSGNTTTFNLNITSQTDGGGNVSF